MRTQRAEALHKIVSNGQHGLEASAHKSGQTGLASLILNLDLH